MPVEQELLTQPRHEINLGF